MFAFTLCLVICTIAWGGRPTRTVLPAADTRGDPTLIDVQDLESSSTEATSFGEVPMAASAADYLEPEESVNATDPAAASAKTSDPNPQDPDYHEYFDSAPIPGVDLSQTSDRPTRRGS